MIDTKALREKILDLAIRGKLVPQDPNEEPASVLLERIREQKKQMVKDGKLKAKDIKNDTVIFKGEDNLHYEKFTDGSAKCIEDEIPFELPKGWEWSRLICISQDLPYGTSKKSFSAGEIAVLRMGNLQNGEIDYTDLVYSSNKEDINQYSLTNGDMLFNRTNSSEWVGKTSIYRAELPAIYAGYLIRIRTFLESEYLNDVMNSRYIKDICSLVKTDAVNQSNINATKLGRFLIPIPPLNEQIVISKKVAACFSCIGHIETEKKDLEQVIYNTKSKILDLAIRGQLVPQDPNDEPASVLLERIRTEKEELIKQGKIKRDKKESIIFKSEDNSYYEKIGKNTICIDDVIPFVPYANGEFVRLSSILELLSGRDLNPNEYNASSFGIPYITGASNFSNGMVSVERWTASPQVITKINDILITCKGTVGEIAFNNFGDAHIARQVMAIRNPYGLNNEYIKLCIEFYLVELKSAAQGLIPGISRSDILDIILPIPTLKYQARIVEEVCKLSNMLTSIEKCLN